MRAFLAVTLSSEVRARLEILQRALIETAADVAWVRPDNLHLTLEFLGEIDAQQAAAVSDAVTRIAAGHTACVIRFDELGAFPSIRSPRILCAGASRSEAGALMGLAEAIRDGMKALGLVQEERPFVPHVTLGRVRSASRRAELSGRLEREARQWRATVANPVESVTLFESRLSARGPAYSVVSESRLSARLER